MLLPATRYIKAHSPGSIQQGLVTSGAAKRAGPGGWRPWEESNGAVLVLSDAFLPTALVGYTCHLRKGMISRRNSLTEETLKACGDDSDKKEPGAPRTYGGDSDN